MTIEVINGNGRIEIDAGNKVVSTYQGRKIFVESLPAGEGFKAYEMNGFWFLTWVRNFDFGEDEYVCKPGNALVLDGGNILRAK